MVPMRSPPLAEQENHLHCGSLCQQGQAHSAGHRTQSTKIFIGARRAVARRNLHHQGQAA